MTPTNLEPLADAILRASGSSLRNYTMPTTRAAILEATEAVYLAGVADAARMVAEFQGIKV